MGNKSYENLYDFPLPYLNQLCQEEKECCNNYDTYNENEYYLNALDISQEDKKLQDEYNIILMNKKDNIESSNDEIDNGIAEQSNNNSTSVSDRQNKQKLIFDIKTINKNLGRKGKNSKSEPTLNDRTRPDNVDNKLLILFSNSTLSYVNLKLFKNINRKKILQRIVPLSKTYKNASQRKALLTKTLGEIFSAPVSERNSTYKKDFNKKLIENLRKNNKNEKYESLLDKTFGEMYQIYKSNTIPEYSLDKDLSLIETDDEDYNALLKYKAQYFIETIINKKGRKE